MSSEKQAKQMASGAGFIAALDQSGGSTPKALGLYGIQARDYSGDDEMYDLIHAMRSRIVNSEAFTGEKVIGAILFEMTMDREINGTPTAQYLWENRGVVPFLKVDKGLGEEGNQVQLMKDMPDLDDLCARAAQQGIFGTKMRSVVHGANEPGIAAIIDQQFEVGQRIISHGLMPILEPEITISIDDKAEAEQIMLEQALRALDQLPDGHQIMFKLTLPENINHYSPLINHPKVMRVVALSGGYERDEANARLAKNSAMIASFSRALTQGLSADQSDESFDQELASTIDSIYQASIT